MPTFEFTAPDGRSYEVTGPDGSTAEQAFGMLQQQISAGTPPRTTESSTAVRAGRTLNDIPRQIGLTARYGLEGLAQAAEVGTEPIRYATDRLLGQTGKTAPLGVMGKRAADFFGLPSPQSANERVVADASRLVAGAGGMLGVAGRAAEVPGNIGRMAAILAANPTQQLSAAAGGGLAGGASREGGGDGWAQAASAVLGTVGGGLAGSAVPAAVSGAAHAARRFLAPQTVQQQTIEARLAAVLSDAGTDYSRLPQDVQRSLRVELAQALQAGKELDPQAVRRLADFRAVGATPTRGAVSQNPVQITREQNLAKMAANSADDSLSGLPMIQNRNNQALIERLNSLGGGAGVEPRDAGSRLASAVLGQQTTLRGAEREAWNAARSSPGYTQPIYPDGLNAINRALGDEAMMPFMNPTVSRYMEAFQTGQQPFTPQAYRNLQSMLANEISKGGNEGAAARIARNALESSEMRPITNPGGIDFGTTPVTQQMARALQARDASAGEAISAVNQARAATRSAYAFEDSSPMVRSILSESRTSEPEKIAQSFILNGTLNEAREIAQHVGPQGRAVIKDALAGHIKQQALSGSSDEVGKVSQAALNKAINKIGADKLRLFFSPEEVAQLQATGRVASYMQAQPAGSAVNNSNSGALVLGRGLDALSQAAKLGPLGKAVIADPVRQWQITMGNNAAADVVPGLLGSAPRRPAAPNYVIPGLALSGALLAPQ